MSTLMIQLACIVNSLRLKSGWAGEKGSMRGSADQQNKPMKYNSVVW